jgi:ABC-type transport system involved in multi-copper enzyme maturation permease subunit
MNWLAWRQHRKQFMIASIFLILFAAFMIPTGLNFWHTYQHALSTCGSTHTCNQLNGELFQSQIDQILIHLVPVAMVFVSILLGIFWGVPLLAREYAEGTNKLVWTQSVSRRKWLTVKLIWVLAGAAIIAAGFAALDTWWAKSNNALTLGRFGPIQFESQGIVLIGYAVFAVSLGVFLGAWLKRTMAAIGITLVLLIAIVMIVVPNFVRPYYYSPISQLTSVDNSNGAAPPNAPQSDGATLSISQTVVNKYNQPINWANPPQQCIVTNPGSTINTLIVGGHTRAAIPTKGGGNVAIEGRNGGPPVDMNCLAPLGYQQEIKYQPSYRYWDFQRIELGLYLALSVIPLAATYWLVLRRDA